MQCVRKKNKVYNRKRKQNKTTTTATITKKKKNERINKQMSKLMFVSMRCETFFFRAFCYFFYNQNLVIRSTFVFFGVGEVFEVGVGVGGGGAIGVEDN